MPFTTIHITEARSLLERAFTLLNQTYDSYEGDPTVDEQMIDAIDIAGAYAGDAVVFLDHALKGAIVHARS
jgi:hypothetical protein